MKFFLNKQKGFTLIELLVVVGIIAILSSILYANFNEARMIARDKARMTSLKEMQLALELYKAQYGTYPEAGCGAINFAGPGEGSGDFTKCANYILGLAPEFIGTLPTDPLFENETNRGYYYRSNGNSYKLMNYDSVEVNLVEEFGHEFARCPVEDNLNCRLYGRGSAFHVTYAVYSAGAELW